MGIAKSIARNTSFEFITEFSELSVAFVTGIVLTRGLGTEQYGLYAYALWLLALTGLITNLGLGEMNRRFIPEAIGRQNTREAVGFIQLALIFKIGVSLFVCLAVIFSSGYWARMSGDSNNRLIFLLVALNVLPAAIGKALEMTFKGFQKFDYSLYLSLAANPLRLVLTIFFIALGFGVLTVIILNIITLTLSVLIGLFLLRKLVPLKSLFSGSLLSGDRKKQALKYALTMMGILILTYLVSQQAETFFIGLYCSVEDVGFYTLAFKIGSIFGVFPAAFGYVLLPAITEQLGKGNTEKMKKIYLTSVRYLMMVALPVAIGGIVLADSIITLFYGADYSPAIILFQVVSLPIAIFSITGASDAVIRGINRPGFLLIMNIFLAIINVGLSMWLIPKYGILGAAIASSAPLVLALPVYVIFVFKRVGLSWPMLSMLKIAIAASIMGVTVYALHTQLGLVPSLVFCVPLGVIVYVIAMFALKAIQEEDIEIFRGLQNSVPLVLRKYYIPLVSLIERTVVRKEIHAEQ